MYREFHRHESEANMNLAQAPKYQPDEAAAISLLQYMTKEQLEEYLSSPDKLDTIIADLPQIKNLQKDRENIIVKNKSLAEFNMGLQPKFEALKQEVATAYEKVNGLKLALGKDVAKLESCAGSQSHDTMLAIFQTETATADEKSEETAENFCDGKVDLDTFISEYLPSRTEAYVKKAKSEKLAELLRHGAVSTGTPYSNAGTPYPAPSGGSQDPGAGHMKGYGGSAPSVGYNPSAGYNPTGGVPYPSPQYGGMPAPYNPR